MALVIAVCGLKGGVGKSTLSLNLAATLHRAGWKALIVDADSQATLRTWAAVAAEAGHDGPPVISVDSKALDRDLKRVSGQYDVVVVDSPARMGAEARRAMIAADLVLCPVVPGAADVWALKETLAVLEEARSLRPELRAAVVMNRTDRTTLAGMTKGALGELDVPVLKTTLGNRVAFGEATLAGQGVVDFAPGSPAAEETSALVHEVLRVLSDHGKAKKRAR